jgi:hypothetical protein
MRHDNSISNDGGVLCQGVVWIGRCLQYLGDEAFRPSGLAFPKLVLIIYRAHVGF